MVQGAPCCQCICDKIAKIPCGGLTHSDCGPRCQNAWQEVQKTFSDVANETAADQKWIVLKKILMADINKREDADNNKGDNKFSQYMNKILLRDELWTGVNKEDKPKRTSKEPKSTKGRLARVWCSQEAIKSEVISDGKSQRGPNRQHYKNLENYKSGQEARGKDPSPLPVSYFNQKLWWSTPDAYVIEKLWAQNNQQAEDKVIKKLGIKKNKITDRFFLTLFEWSVVEKWRKPTCIDGITHSYFKVNTNGGEFGFTRYLDPSTGEIKNGYREIVHTVKDDGNVLKLG